MDMLMREMHTALQPVEDMLLCSMKDGIWILEWGCREVLPIIQSMLVQNVER